jgi:hypothetical protein
LWLRDGKTNSVAESSIVELRTGGSG